MSKRKINKVNNIKFEKIDTINKKIRLEYK